ncbi:MAG: helix-turn-helix domain-containing protein [Ktedonobacterales bacterium]
MSKLRAAMHERGIHVKDVAGVAGLEPSYVSRILRGAPYGDVAEMRLARAVRHMGLDDVCPVVSDPERGDATHAGARRRAQVFRPDAQELLRALAFALDVPLPLPPSPGAPDADRGEEPLP